MFSRSNTSSPATTRKNSFDAAKEYFRDNPNACIFTPVAQFTTIMTLPPGKPMLEKISPGTIVL